MDGTSLDITAEKIQQLKAIFPEVFSEDKIDFQRLKQVFGEEIFVKGEHYELSWAGKSEARKEIQKQTTATLIPDRENSIDFDNAQNVFIEGENLEVLRVLQKSYFGKVKMIYIDPPYNTGNDSFVYPDDYTERQNEYKKRTKITNEEGFLNKQDLWKKNTKENGQFHSVWLSMMYPRLYLSRNLLKEDGVIFISIDDNEASNLKLLCDEIFGEENFISTIIWQRAFAPVNMNRYFSLNHDYCLVYTKNISQIKELGLPRSEGSNDRYSNPDDDLRGVWMSGDFSVGPAIESKIYPITNPAGKELYPPSGRCWRVTKEKYQELLADNRIWFGENGDNVPRLKRFITEVQDKSVPLTVWTHQEVGHSQSAKKDLNELFDGKAYFDYPKSIPLIKRMLQLGTKSNENHLILDFFAGSGTTAQAVMELNEEDGGKRQFICVQMPEPTAENSEAFKAGYKTIADITKARIEKVIQKISKAREGKIEFAKKASPICNNFILADSNFKVWQSSVKGVEALTLQLYEHRQSEKQTDEQDKLFVELCLKSGLGLSPSYAVEILNENLKVYQVENMNVWFCFDKYTSVLKDAILAQKPKKIVMLNSCFERDMELTNFQLELTDNNLDLTIV